MQMLRSLTCKLYREPQGHLEAHGQFNAYAKSAWDGDKGWLLSSEKERSCPILCEEGAIARTRASTLNRYRK